MVLCVLDDADDDRVASGVRVATSAYILIAIRLEEHDLDREFGHTYEDYRRRVPMLVPFARARQKPADAAERRAAV